MPNRFIWSFLHIFGVPRGQWREFYRNLALATIAVPAMLLAFVFAVTDRLGSKQFWYAMVVSAICFLLASGRRAIVALGFLIAAIRFGFAFVMTWRLSALLASLVCAAVVWLLVNSRKNIELSL